MTTCNKAIKHRLIRADQKKQGLDYQILDTIFLEMESPLPRLLACLLSSCLSDSSSFLGFFLSVKTVDFSFANELPRFDQ